MYLFWWSNLASLWQEKILILAADVLIQPRARRRLRGRWTVHAISL